MLPPEDWYKTTFIIDWGAFGPGHHAIQFEERPPPPIKEQYVWLLKILGHFREVILGQLQ